MGEEGLAMVPPLPPKYRLKDAILGDHGDADRVRVKFFTNENTLKERLQIYFIRNQRSSLRIRMFNFLIKILSCVLYVARVVMEENLCNQQQQPQQQRDYNITTMASQDDDDDKSIDWSAIFWVCRDVWFWGIQVTVAIISLLETLLMTYLAYKGNLLQQLLSPEFILELVTTVPLIVTIFYPPIRILFVPVFLNCWLAEMALNNMLNDLNRAMQKSQSALSRHLLLLTMTLGCLVFTSVCGFQHLQRGSKKKVSLFDSLWFVIVTFSTVGYGDMYPTIWPSKLFIMMLICMIFIVLPKQFEQLAYTWMERQKMGGSYSSHRAHSEKHVVVVATVLQTDVIVDFLNEFYAHPKVQDYYVVLLSPCDLNATLKLILQVPLWAARVIYIQGSALKDVDLTRCRMQNAEACFFIMTRNEQDKSASDEHTILRSWAVRDFAPHCPQYLQIFKPESKIHVYSAEFMVCEDEFKYSLLANNCLYPGVSTFMTLLLHTSDGAEGQVSDEEWMRLYGKCSGNEIYHVSINGSLFFGDYIGKSFTYASFNSHRKYGVCLVGVVTGKEAERVTLINPGCDYILHESDICLYLSLAKEETAAVIKSGKKVIENKAASICEKEMIEQGKIGKAKDQYNMAACRLEQVVTDVQKQSEVFGDFSSAVPDSADAHIFEEETAIDSRRKTAEAYAASSYPSNYNCGEPPVTPYIGVSQRMCHLVRTKRHLCCLEMTTTCEHTSNCKATDYKWPNKCVIVVADKASTALFNFIAILRAQHIDHRQLKPIVLVVEDSPENSFLDTISYFPMVYWMTGSLESLDDLLKAGIMVSDSLVIVNKEASNAGDEDTLADCNTLVAAQTIFRLFPTCNIVMELSQASNMRFMQFRPHDPLSLKISNFERKEKEKGSHLYFMFRPPFASGCVFSASMLDTILYQAYVKDFVIQFVRLLLGIDENPHSGHLSCIKMTCEDMWIGSYGRLYQKLCSSSREIPIGIYRTQRRDASTFSTMLMMGRGCIDFGTVTEVERMVRSRMEALGVKCRQMVEQMAGDAPLAPLATPESTHVSSGEYTLKCRNLVNGRENISYVIINPNTDTELQLDDVIYVIKPPTA
uniref:Putative potassium channel subfamily T n=1 Tax=Hirudo verbana TaxID=311461 RepID=A0A2S1WM70_9ANNE|nr:putative potassium channel subfamily T [Hirudo verbana]